MLIHYNPSTSALLKIDRSSKCMGYLLMQPANDDKSTAAIATLRDTDVSLFDISFNSPRLLPIECVK